MGSVVSVVYGVDSASSDTGSFDCEGYDASCDTCVRIEALATTSLACVLEVEKAEVSDSGVNDHAIKFPGA